MVSKKKSTVIVALLVLCLFVCGFGMQAFAAGVASEGDAVNVIEKEVAFGTITADNGGEWSRTDLSTRNIMPIASSGRSVEYKGNSGWIDTFKRTLATPIDAAETLGVTITGEGKAKESDMGVAFWLYVGNEATKEALKLTTIKVWFGPSAGSCWHEEVFKIDDFKIGWNEVIIKHNPNWYATYPGEGWTANPTDEQINSISYMSIVIENMDAIDKYMAINGIRLVKTLQTTPYIINRHENYSVKSDDAQDLDAAVKSISGVSVVNTTLPDGTEGEAIKLGAGEVQGGMFAQPVNATTPDKGWNSQTDVAAWQSSATLSFWWFIPDAAAYKNAIANKTAGWSSIQLTSSDDKFAPSASLDLIEGNTALNHEEEIYRYLNTGWNQVFITVYGSGIDIGNLTGLRIVNIAGAAQDFMLYDIKLGRGNVIQRGVINDGVSGDPFPDSSNIADVTDGASVTGWNGIEKVQDKGPDGTVVKSLVVKKDASNFDYTAQSDVDVSAFEQSFLAVNAWIYTDNAKTVNSGLNKIMIAESAAKLESDEGYSINLGGGCIFC